MHVGDSDIDYWATHAAFNGSYNVGVGGYTCEDVLREIARIRPGRTYDPPAEQRTGRPANIERLWNEGLPIAGTPAEAYLTRPQRQLLCGDYGGGASPVGLRRGGYGAQSPGSQIRLPAQTGPVRFCPPAV